MSVEDSGRHQGPALAARAAEQEDLRAWSKQLLRLLIAPTVATLLFIGGVYWIRLQPRTGAFSENAAAIVQVRLLPLPNPIPVPVVPTTPSATASAHGQPDHTSDVSASKSNDMTADQPVQESSPGPAATPNLGASPVVNAPQNSIIAEFREALLHRIASYQRYPKDAERKRLRGTVDTVFSLTRDGRLLGVWVKTSSGEPLLDKEALDTIRRAQPLPPIPAGLPNPLRIELALGFDPP
jgi:periplasmic protein TonB